jgi:hypothetical protein
MAVRRDAVGRVDLHAHPTIGGLHHNLELICGGIPSPANAVRTLREQAKRTPPNLP